MDEDGAEFCVKLLAMPMVASSALPAGLGRRVLPVPFELALWGSVVVERRALNPRWEVASGMWVRVCSRMSLPRILTGLQRSQSARGQIDFFRIISAVFFRLMIDYVGLERLKISEC